MEVLIAEVLVQEVAVALHIVQGQAREVQGLQHDLQVQAQKVVVVLQEVEGEDNNFKRANGKSTF